MLPASRPGAAFPMNPTLSRIRWLLAVAAILVVVGPVTAASAADGTDPAATPPASAATGEDPTEEEPDPLWPIAAPSKARGATVARVVVTSTGRPRLSSTARGIRVSTQTAWSKQSQTLLVLDGAERGGRRWVKVLLGSRPNGRTAWIQRDHVVLSSTRWWIDVSTRLRQVTVYRDGKRMRRFRGVVGARRTPTPHTLSAVYELNRQPNPKGFLGTWVVALTSHSNVLENYGGGPGRVAIHGRGGESLKDPLGSARSHGCVRVTNKDVGYLAKRIPPGTPVDLRK